MHGSRVCARAPINSAPPTAVRLNSSRVFSTQLSSAGVDCRPRGEASSCLHRNMRRMPGAPARTSLLPYRCRLCSHDDVTSAVAVTTSERGSYPDFGVSSDRCDRPSRSLQKRASAVVLTWGGSGSQSLALNGHSGEEGGEQSGADAEQEEAAISADSAAPMDLTAAEAEGGCAAAQAYMFDQAAAEAFPRSKLPGLDTGICPFDILKINLLPIQANRSSTVMWSLVSASRPRRGRDVTNGQSVHA